MTVVGIINQKGGVGKTTSTYVLGELASRNDKKVLIVGLDGQRNIDQMYRISDETDPSLLLEYPEDCIINIKENLDIIPTPSPEELDEELTYEDPSLLSSALDRIYDDYDIILIDSPPSRGKTFYNIITASEKYLIPMKPSYFDVMGCDKLMEIITKEKGDEIGKDILLLPTMFRNTKDSLNGVCIIYSFAISAYNNFEVNGLDIHDLILQKKDKNGRLIKELPKDVARIKQRISRICKEYSLEYEKEVLVNPVPEAVIYRKLFGYDDFQHIIDDKMSFLKNFHPYRVVLKRLMLHD